MTTAGYVHALAFDEAAQRLLFAGVEGVIGYVDLETGATGKLLDPPQRWGIVQMAVSEDRRGLCCVCNAPELHGRQPPVLRIWNYPALDKPRLRLLSPDAS
jgi:hypothetical protein